MASTIRYIEGFDDVAASADLGDYGWSGGFSAVTAPGRFGFGKYARIASGSAPIKGYTPDAKVTIGTAFRTEGVAAGGTIFRLREAGTEHGRLSFNADASLTISRAGSIPATSAPIPGFVDDSFIHVEVGYWCHDTTGAWEVRANGVVVIGPTTGLDTRAGGTAGLLDQVYLDNGGAANNYDYDDLVIATGDHTHFRGDCRVITRLPTGDGANTGLTPSSGGTHFDDVDDASPNDDTDYVTGDAIGEKDSYTYAAIGLPGSIIAVQPVFDAKKTDSGTRSVATLIRRGGVDYDGTGQALAAGYAGYWQVYELDPSTGLAWTTADVDAAEFGVKVTA
jgi:hypothetical protein